MLALAATLIPACPIEDGTAYGEPYTIAAKPAPHVSANELVFSATYKSMCTGGAAPFDVTKFDSFDPLVVLIASRGAASCARPTLEPQEYTHEVRLPMPASAFGFGDRYIGCPPGSAFEMMPLATKAASNPTSEASTPTESSTPPVDWDPEEDGVWEPGEPPALIAEAAEGPVAEDQRVEKELATHSPEDSRAFLAHCETKRASGEPCKCCTDLMMDRLREKVAREATDDTSAANASTEVMPPTLHEITIDASGATAALGATNK